MPHLGKGGGGGGGGGRKAGLLRAALCLHGKIGSIDRGQGWTRAVDGGSPTLDVMVISYAGNVRHIIEANRATHTVDVFGHSWSPELGPALDALYQPKGALHEREEFQRNRKLCAEIGIKLRQLTTALGNTPYTHYGMVGRGANSCERTASHLLGMQRAIQLKAREERAKGFKYDVVMVARWDVLWSRPLLFSKIDTTGNAFALPSYCTHESHIDHNSPVEKAFNDMRKATCGGGHSAGQVPTAAQSCHPSHRPCSPDLSARARELYLLDWWFVSSSRSADGFALVGEPALYTNYTLLNQERLISPKHARPTIMGHAYWGMHMVWGLRAQLKFVAAIAVDFSLGRVWKRDVGANTCRATKAVCAGADGARRVRGTTMCSTSDLLQRPWQAQDRHGVAVGEIKVPAREKPLVFSYGAAQTSYGCGVGMFTCHGASRMCKEEQLTWEPMDTSPMREKWIECTKPGFCQQFGLHPYSPRCAGALLATWAQIWKHSSWVSNTTLAKELVELGQLDNSALGWYDPADAAATLTALTRHSIELLHDGQEKSPTGEKSVLSIARVTHNCSAARGGGAARHAAQAVGQ